jgi:protein O-GlcNAc transferase
MAKKFKQYTNPLTKAEGSLASDAFALPNLHNAIALHQLGQLGQAEAIYRRLLQIDSKNADAFHLLGAIAHQTGQNQKAIDLIGKAIEINPNVASYYSSQGNALKELRQLNAAVLSYKKAIALKSDYAEAHYNLGLALQELKQLQGAVASYEKAILLKPDFVEAYTNLGLAFQALRQLDASIAKYDEAIALKPDFAEAYYNRGNALLELKQLVGAVANYDKAIALQHNYVEAYANRGNALRELKQLEGAIASYERAVVLKPDLAEVHYNLGLAFQEIKQLDVAVAYFDKAITLKPELVEAYCDRGNALLELKQLGAAVASYSKAIALKPDYAAAYSNQGLALQEFRQLNAAVASYDRAIAIQPDYAEAYYNRGNALKELKQLEAAIVSYDMAITLKPDYEYLFGLKQHTKMRMCYWQDFKSNLIELRKKIQRKLKASTCFPLLALPIGLAHQRQAAETWIKDKYPYKSTLGQIPKPERKSKIRIGYFSADFHNHATAYLMAELLERHDKDKFELIAISFGSNIQDEMRHRIKKSVNQFIDVTYMSDQAVARKSRELDIDIAIDLKGLTQDARLTIFSYKAAPIQVSYLGYPGTLGADYIDYLIADKTLIPNESQEHYSEKIVYLPNSYQVNDSHRAIAPTQFTKQDLGLPNDSFVFCCFNNNYKITPDVFDSWVRILKAVDGSVLWLFEDNQTAATNLRKEAALRGLDPSRLIFAKHMDLPEHLARHKAADLFLDTLPYNAHTTASDALWAGLPVLTCMGESFASRVAASLLFAIGLPELVTETTNEYEALAIELATNSHKLKAIKDKLESNRLTTPLFDTVLFTKHIEAAYIEMYDRYQADLTPDHIYITDLNIKNKD